MTTGQNFVEKAAAHIGEKYAFVPVPKNNPNWKGPWDCAELVSWAVYQLLGKLYGCINNAGDPAEVEAYSGSWANDAKSLLPSTTMAHAMTVPGIVLVRRPGLHGYRYGHVAISDGQGKVVEAAGVGLGVRRHRLQGRPWDYIVTIPGIRYAAGAPNTAAPVPLPFMLRLTDPWTRHPIVKVVQRALKKADFDPGPVDGAFGPNTTAAVIAFQQGNRLLADGVVGPKTAARLGVELPP